MGRLDGKVAIITGATSGIGESSAVLLAEEGAIIILIGRNEEKGKILESIINRNGGISHFIKCDITKEIDVIKVKELVSSLYGKADILFNNAGVFITGALENIDKDEWNKTFDTNVTGYFLMTKHMMPMLKENHGVILNNASIAGMQSYVSGNSYMYSASKAAVIQFTKVCAKNYARDVRINCICPGIVDTPIYTNRDMSRFDDRIPLGRVATPEEIAKVVLFMVSEDSSYITGIALPVDGGVSI